MPWWLLVPVLILGIALFVMLLLLVLGRYKNGALLRPLIARLSRIGFMRRFFARVSTAAIERQNPELASAMKKLQNVGNNPVAAQKAMSRLSPAERRAYMEMAQEQQDQTPELMNRQNRRRLQQQTRGARPGGGGGSSRKRKRR